MLIDYFPNIKAIILDMDGVLWRDKEPIGNLPLIFQTISKQGLKCILATNNATKTISEYIEKLKGFDVTITQDQIVTSAMATGNYLKQKFSQQGNVFILGSSSLKETLEEYGFFSVEDPNQDNILAVVAGLDRDLTYEKLAKATSLVRKGIPLIGTNPDITYPTPNGLLPGAGTIIKAVEIASESEAIIIGKPKPELYLMALRQLEITPQDTLVVGDRLDTDILGAQEIGCLSALVLSGATSYEQAQLWYPKPEFIVKDLESLLGI